MRRALVAVAAGAALAACARRPAGEAVPRLAAEPWVRVGIVVDRDSGGVSATGQFRVLAADGAILAVQDAGRSWRVEPAEGGRLTLTRPDRPEPLVVPGPITVRPELPGDHVVINGRTYRGEAVLQSGTTGVTILNRVPLEAYLRSVVALELGFRGAEDRQAVMAQAVAARTYAIRSRGRREALGFDVFPTDADQAYNGTEAESPEVADAVSRTAGQILTHGGRPIEALFHSTCGWSTASNEEVFQNRAPVPYLRAVSDRFGSGDDDFYCRLSPRFRWREEWDGGALAALIARGLTTNGALGRITDITAATTTTGRVGELVVTAAAGRYTVPGWRLREVLRPAPDRWLSSTLVQLHVEKRDGEVVRVVAAGAGYGHGVGMCQFGALGRARAGQDYRTILATYYQGTRLERVY